MRFEDIAEKIEEILNIEKKYQEFYFQKKKIPLYFYPHELNLKNGDDIYIVS